MDNQGRKRLLYPLLALAILVAAAIACAPRGPAPAVPAEEEPVLEVVQDVSFEVKREIPLVRVGDRFPLPEVQDYDFHPLPVGHMVTTGDIGEALLRGEFEGQPCTVYVFKDSELCKDTCRESDRKAGNSFCLCVGASGFRGCSNSLVQTETADFDVSGSWFEVFYLPDEQRSLVMVLEGEVEARPVIDVEARTLGPATEVDGGFFWFTDPGTRADPVAGYTGREPHPLEEMLPVIEELELEPWMVRTEFRADLDDVSFPQWTEEEPECVVRAENLNLRRGPGTIYNPPLTVLQQGAVLRPFQRNRDGTWIIVFEDETGREGWVTADSRYVSCTGEISDLPVAVIPPTPTSIPTATPTRTPVPTRTPRPTPTEPPPPYVELPPTLIELNAMCEACTVVRWHAENVRAVYLDGDAVAVSGIEEVCLDSSDLYELESGYTDELHHELGLRIVTDEGDIWRSTDIVWRYPHIEFWADNTLLEDDPCTVLHWEVDGVQAVYLDGEGVAGHGGREVCPADAHTYVLQVVTECGEIGREVTIGVNADPDGDGLTTADEQHFGTDPQDYDTDGDGLHDGAEVAQYSTDPTWADTDGDGYDDGREVNILGSDPLDPDDPPRILYDFVAEADTAAWSSRASELPFAGADNDDRGFVLWRRNYPMEDGSYPAFVLETHPEWTDWGYIEGTYDQTRDMVISGNDYFVARVGLIQGAGAGDVTFRVYFSDASTCFVGEEFPRQLGELRDWYDGQTRYWEIPLGDLAGQRGCFQLNVFAGETSAQDWATWIEARIERR